MLMDAFASLQAAIREQIDCSPGEPFGVLDFDNTCIINDVAEITLAYMCRHRLLKCDDLLPLETPRSNGEYHQQVFRLYHALLGRGDIKSASRLCARIFTGFGPAEAGAIVSAAMDAEGNVSGKAELFGVSITVGLAVRLIVRNLIDHLMANNVQVWIVSASPEIAVRTAMKRFDIPGNLIALRNRIDHNVISKEIDEPQPIVEGKVDCIKTFVDARNRPLVGVGDSIYDLPMLEYATVRAVVDGDQILMKNARLRGWFILEP
jgi:phosphoserine phosphatase